MLLLNLYTVPFDTDENDIEPLLATVLYTFVSLFAEFATAIEIAFIVVFDVNGCVFIAVEINPFAKVVFTLPFLILITAVSYTHLTLPTKRIV